MSSVPGVLVSTTVVFSVPNCPLLVWTQLDRLALAPLLSTHNGPRLALDFVLDNGSILNIRLTVDRGRESISVETILQGEATLQLSWTSKLQEWDNDFVLQVKCTIFWLNRCLRVYLDLYAPDFQKIPLITKVVRKHEVKRYSKLNFWFWESTLKNEKWNMPILPNSLINPYFQKWPKFIN